MEKDTKKRKIYKYIHLFGKLVWNSIPKSKETQRAVNLLLLFCSSRPGVLYEQMVRWYKQIHKKKKKNSNLLAGQHFCHEEVEDVCKNQLLRTANYKSRHCLVRMGAVLLQTINSGIAMLWEQCFCKRRWLTSYNNQRGYVPSPAYQINQYLARRRADMY